MQYVYVPPTPKDWISQGSEKEVEEENVVEIREKVSMIIPRDKIIIPPFRGFRYLIFIMPYLGQICYDKWVCTVLISHKFQSGSKLEVTVPFELIFARVRLAF